MTFDEWWLKQIEKKSDEMNVPEMWLALRLLAKDAWDSSRKALGTVSEYSKQISLNTKSLAVREELIHLGWAPPLKENE